MIDGFGWLDVSVLYWEILDVSVTKDFVEEERGKGSGRCVDSVACRGYAWGISCE